ncbi:MAG: 4-alpha-glucanotransferase [Candidatus Nanopelagicales bacterium]|nr:4-alpha-glucanotransferase [Candidatus Nanopelagicales bacterium]
MSEHDRSALLVELARVNGVATEYWDQAGQQVVVEGQTLAAVLTALGYDTTDDATVAASLQSARTRDWRRMLPAFTVGVQGQERRLWVHVSHGDDVEVWVEAEDGFRTDLVQMDYWVDPVEVDGMLIGEASFTIPHDLPIGYYSIHAASGVRTATAPMAMTPGRLDPEAITGDRQWGFMAQIYATRSQASWGLGDLRDCADLAAWSAAQFGAGFLLINPLHAAAPTAPMAPSPYLPVTRRFANPMYLRVEDVPEYAELGRRDRRRIEHLGQPLRERDRTTDLLDRDAVWAAKREALTLVFRSGLTPERARQFADFCRREGQGLVDFATWSTLCDVYSNEPSAWPPQFDDRRSQATLDFAAAHASSVQFHMWLQWVFDEQLTRTQAAAKGAGMAIGIMHDLAVGVHPEGSDAWALRDVLAQRVSVGAPPDMYNQMGQDWSQPPWHPRALAEAGYGPYRDLLRTMMRHAGGLRIDHVLGLFRLWWVPNGLPANLGTFVTYDHEAMIGILVLEAHRAGVIVIGEDLGTVEPWVQDVLRDRGILGTSILWFETADGGHVKRPQDWRREVLASVTVHDLPPTAGFLRDEHVRIRHELNLLARPVEEEQEASRQEREEWARILRESGWLAPDADLATDAGLDAMALALHRALGASPCRLLGVALPDVVGDRRAQNQPGTDQEYPNWRVPMTDASGTPVLLEDLYANPAPVATFVDALRQG